MKTLAQFKKDIQIGDVIEVIGFTETILKDTPQEYTNNHIPPKLTGKRKVTYKDTTGFYLKDINIDDNKKGSFCGYPKASNLEYVDNFFTINEIDLDTKQIYQTRIYKITK